MSNEIFYKAHGAEFGPITRVTLLEMVRNQVLGTSDQYRVGAGKWSDIAEILSSVPAVNSVAGRPAGTPVSGAPAASAESAPWVYLARTGVIGPLTTGQFLSAVQGGSVQSKTMIRLLPSPEWISAEQIQGLEFPKTGPAEVANGTGPASRPAAPRTVPNAEMRHLFAECVSRQKAHQPVAPTRSPYGASSGVGSRLGGVFGSAAGGITGGVVRVLELVFAVPLYLVRSRVAWGIALLLFVVLAYPRIAAYLTTQTQMYTSLHQTYEEMTRLQIDKTDDATWNEFRTRATSDLAHLLPQLERNATTSDKKSMSLLWLARDYLPAMLKDPKSIDAATRNRVGQHMAIVRTELSMWGDSSRGFPWTTTIIVVDVLGVLAAVAYFRRGEVAVLKLRVFALNSGGLARIGRVAMRQEASPCTYDVQKDKREW